MAGICTRIRALMDRHTPKYRNEEGGGRARIQQQNGPRRRKAGKKIAGREGELHQVCIINSIGSTKCCLARGSSWHMARAHSFAGGPMESQHFQLPFLSRLDESIATISFTRCKQNSFNSTNKGARRQRRQLGRSKLPKWSISKWFTSCQRFPSTSSIEHHRDAHKS